MVALSLAVWMERGAAGDPGVVVASAVVAPWSRSRGFDLVAAVLPSGWVGNLGTSVWRG